MTGIASERVTGIKSESLTAFIGIRTLAAIGCFHVLYGRGKVSFCPAKSSRGRIYETFRLVNKYEQRQRTCYQENDPARRLHLCLLYGYTFGLLRKFLAATIPKKPTWSERWTWATATAPQMSAQLIVNIRDAYSLPPIRSSQLTLSKSVSPNIRCRADGTG